MYNFPSSGAGAQFFLTRFLTWIPSRHDWFELALETRGMERISLFAYQQSSLAVITIFVGVKFVWSLEQMRENGTFYTPTCRVRQYHNYCSLLFWTREKQYQRKYNPMQLCFGDPSPIIRVHISQTNRPIWLKVCWLSVYCLHSIHAKFKQDRSDGSQDTSFHYYLFLFWETPALSIFRIFRRASPWEYCIRIRTTMFWVIDQ